MEESKIKIDGVISKIERTSPVRVLLRIVQQQQNQLLLDVYLPRDFYYNNLRSFDATAGVEVKMEAKEGRELVIRVKLKE